MFPLAYKGIAANYNEGIALSDFPICNWVSNPFANWLAQHEASKTIGAVVGALSIAAGIALPAAGMVGAVVGGGLAVGGVTKIASMIGEEQDAKVLPPQANGNSNQGSINCAMGVNTFQVDKISIKAENAQLIDDYFEMYGYSTLALEVPNMNSRPHWNYVKTADCNLKGNIPDEDMKRLKQIFNNGVTFWHNPSEVGDYSLNNHN
jgi:hypothetical protein